MPHAGFSGCLLSRAGMSWEHSCSAGCPRTGPRDRGREVGPKKRRRVRAQGSTLDKGPGTGHCFQSLPPTPRPSLQPARLHSQVWLQAVLGLSPTRWDKVLKRLRRKVPRAGGGGGRGGVSAHASRLATGQRLLLTPAPLSRVWVAVETRVGPGGGMPPARPKKMPGRAHAS